MASSTASAPSQTTAGALLSSSNIRSVKIGDSLFKCLFSVEQPTSNELVPYFSKPLIVGKKALLVGILKPLIQKRAQVVNFVGRVSGVLKENADFTLPGAMKDLSRLDTQSLGKIFVTLVPMFEVASENARVLPSLKDPFAALVEVYKKAFDASYIKKLGEMKAHFGTVSLEQQRTLYIGPTMRMPTKPEFHHCMCCGCKSIHEPETNTEKQVEDIKAMKDYTKRKREIKVGNKVAAKKSGDGKILQAPPPPKLHPILMLCSYHFPRCTQKGSDIQLTCPILCVNPATGHRYEWDNAKSGCQCLCCLCKCNVAYKVSIDFGHVSCALFIHCSAWFGSGGRKGENF